MCIALCFTTIPFADKSQDYNAIQVVPVAVTSIFAVSQSNQEEMSCRVNLIECDPPVHSPCFHLHNNCRFM